MPELIDFNNIKQIDYKKRIVDNLIKRKLLAFGAVVVGFLFEALCLRDLRIYVEANDGNIYYYREEKGFEVDAVLELRDGSWGAVEIKLGADAETLNIAANNLLKLKEKINTDVKGTPSFLMILYGGRHAYKREDGVFVVPIGCLKN